MARQPFDAFLPSGAVEQAHYYPPACEPRFAAIAPMAAPPRGYPDHIPSPVVGGRSRSPRPCASPPSVVLPPHLRQAATSSPPRAFAIDQHRRERPLSPPFSRSSSTEESRAAQVQRWRLYTQHLRETAQGERAHMEADRARLEEVMAEERALWDEERDHLKGRIEQLEGQLAVTLGHPDGQYESGNAAGSVPPPQTGQSHPPQPANAITSGTTATNGTSSQRIPQESGRNPDGSPFYAPAPRNPSRTFDETQSNDLRVDSMSAPRETPLRVTSKELKKSDFGLQSAPAETFSRDRRDGSVASESIDISHLQPELEGVPIKASAVAPEFAALVLSPNSSLSPSKPSSNTDSPTRRDPPWNPEGAHRGNSQTKISTLEIIAAPETRRLTMNAGHTPNHSIHKIDLGDSGNATPTQSHHPLRHLSIAPGPTDLRVDENIDPDPELRGPLGLRNDAPKDEIFLSALTDKLNEIKDTPFTVFHEAPSQGVASSVLLEIRQNEASSVASPPRDDDDSEEAVDEAPVLRVKASMNFGRPFGSL